MEAVTMEEVGTAVDGTAVAAGMAADVVLLAMEDLDITEVGMVATGKMRTSSCGTI